MKMTEIRKKAKQAGVKANGKKSEEKVELC